MTPEKDNAHHDVEAEDGTEFNRPDATDNEQSASSPSLSTSSLDTLLSLSGDESSIVDETTSMENSVEEVAVGRNVPCPLCWPDGVLDANICSNPYCPNAA